MKQRKFPALWLTMPLALHGLAGCYLGPGPLPPSPPGVWTTPEDYERATVCEDCIATWMESERNDRPCNFFELSVPKSTRAGVTVVSVGVRSETPELLWVRGRIDLEGTASTLRYRDSYRGNYFGSEIELFQDVRPLFSTQIAFVVGRAADGFHGDANAKARGGPIPARVLLNLVFEMIGPGSTRVALRDVRYAFSERPDIPRFADETVIEGTLEIHRKPER